MKRCKIAIVQLRREDMKFARAAKQAHSRAVRDITIVANTSQWQLTVWLLCRYVMGVRTLVPSVPGDALCWVARRTVTVPDLLENDF